MYFKKILLLSLLTIKGSFAFDNLIPKEQKISMKTSVIIPCVARHFFWLSGLLESYQNQTTPPDEIIISLSEVEKLNPKEIINLQNGCWSFDLKIISNEGIVRDGENRTIAMDNSTGEILIFSDADDLAHPQRVELVKFLFENYEIDHILHSFAFARSEMQSLEPKNLKPLKFNTFQDAYSYAQKNNIPITTGSPCFLRKIGQHIKWYADDDVQYAQQVYKLFKNNIMITEKLILYRVALSSHKRAKQMTEHKL